MLKIYNNIGSIGQIYDSISQGFLDYVPADKFIETDKIEEADILFMSGAIHDNGRLEIHMLNNVPIDLGNISEVSKKLGIIGKKKRVIWLDVMGPNINTNDEMFAQLKKTDIIVTSCSVPSHTHLFTHIYHVEKNTFRNYGRFQRAKGSVMISYDNLADEVSWFKNVMPSISELHVTKSQSLAEHVVSELSEHKDKITSENLTYPKGVAYKASHCEFVVHTHTTWGTEFMGIEAGMCGCIPIYPDTAFYRDIFDGTGVLFYDTANAAESLTAVIQNGYVWTPEQIEAFRSRFCAEDNLPKFWDSVFEIYADS